MRTASELVGLAKDAGLLWVRYWAPLLGWFSLGYGINELTGHVSTLLVGQRILGTTIIVLGIVAWVACLVLAIQSLGPGLDGVTGTETRRLEVLSAALGPFMAVYGAWGLAEEQFNRLIQANLMTHGIDADQFSVNAGDWAFFGWFALAALALRFTVRWIGRRARWRGFTFVGLLADGAWVFASFFVLREWASAGFDWLSGRAVWRWLQNGWDGFVGVLPDVTIWFELTLPEALRMLGARLWDLVVPGFANAVLLPLMWVALVGTVFGRRNFAADDILRGTKVEAKASAMLDRGARTPLGRLVALFTSELREKYVPMLSTLALLRHAGLRLLGTFLVLVALIQLGGDWLDRGVLYVIGPRPLPDTLLYAPTTNFLVSLVTTTALLACYATAFQRAVARQADQRQQPRRDPARPSPTEQPEAAAALPPGRSDATAPTKGVLEPGSDDPVRG